MVIEQIKNKGWKTKSDDVYLKLVEGKRIVQKSGTTNRYYKEKEIKWFVYGGIMGSIQLLRFVALIFKKAFRQFLY